MIYKLYKNVTLFYILLICVTLYNETFVKVSHLVTFCDTLEQNMILKYRIFILYIAFFTVRIYTISELYEFINEKRRCIPQCAPSFFSESELISRILTYYRFFVTSFKYSANSSFKSSLESAKSTVACKNPCLLPISYLLPSKSYAYISSSFASITSASVS